MSLWLIVNDPNNNPTRLINLEHFKEYNVETSLRIAHPDDTYEQVYGLYGYLEHEKRGTNSAIYYPAEKVLLAYFNSKNEATATLTKIIMAIAENDVIKKDIVIESAGGYYL